MLASNFEQLTNTNTPIAATTSNTAAPTHFRIRITFPMMCASVSRLAGSFNRGATRIGGHGRSRKTGNSEPPATPLAVLARRAL
jgi:hypothetical protein